MENDQTNIQNESKVSIHYRKKISAHSLDNKANNISKIIIPYNFTNNTYSIQDSIEFYDGKEYIKLKLNDFSNDPLFHMDHEYQFTKVEKFLSYLPNIILTILLIYLTIYILVNCFFNPGIFLFAIVIIFKLYFFLDERRFINREKKKINKISEILENENNSSSCKYYGLKWILGMNGYWIEIHKKI